MDKYTAQEQAFKRGYEKGYKAALDSIVRCKDCAEWDEKEQECKHWYGFYADNFCSYGEKKPKPNITDQTIDALNKMGDAVHGG